MGTFKDYAGSVVELDLAGLWEVAEILGVSRQRVDQLITTYEDFPEPVAHLAAGRIWLRKEIENWQRQHRHRPPGRPKERRDK